MGTSCPVRALFCLFRIVSILVSDLQEATYLSIWTSFENCYNLDGIAIICYNLNAIYCYNLDGILYYIARARKQKTVKILCLRLPQTDTSTVFSVLCLFLTMSSY